MEWAAMSVAQLAVLMGVKMVDALVDEMAVLMVAKWAVLMVVKWVAQMVDGKFVWKAMT